MRSACRAHLAALVAQAVRADGTEALAVFSRGIVQDEEIALVPVAQTLLVHERQVARVERFEPGVPIDLLEWPAAVAWKVETQSPRAVVRAALGEDGCRP